MSKLYETKKAADSYDSSRDFPPETRTLWMDVIRELVPTHSVKKILDLGGGTGRFSFMLKQIYDCPIVTTDPSTAMLKQGEKHNDPAIAWIASKAEYIPFADNSFDLVFMSQVYHHIENMEQAFTGINRILKPEGRLLIRNGTLESDNYIQWHSCFPGLTDYDIVTTPSRIDIENNVSEYGLTMMSMQMVNQIFASSYEEYYRKISRRGLSALIALSDEAFSTGLEKFREWTDRQPKNTPVHDPVDIFLFKKA